MRYCLSAVFFCLAGLVCIAGGASNTVQQALNVHFSPAGDCTATIDADIDAAKDRIFVQAYVLTSTRIANALAKAKGKGVSVEVILDGKGSKVIGSKYTWLLSNGVKVLLDQSHPIAHNKVIVIDSRQVLTGSFNFSDQAEKENAENLLEVNDENIAKSYEKNWYAHRKHSMEQLHEEAPAESKASNPPTTSCPNCQNGQCGVTPRAIFGWRR